MIKQISAKEAYDIIIASFSETELNITKEQCPGYSGFLNYEHLLKEEAEGLRLFGYYKDQLVGCVALAYKSNVRYKLKYLAVLKAYRKQGIGNELMTFAESVARDEHCQYIKLGMIRDNEKLYDFYTARGYLTKKINNYKHNAYRIAFMEKKL